MRRIYTLSQALYRANESDISNSRIIQWIAAEIKDHKGILDAWIPNPSQIFVEINPAVLGNLDLDRHVQAILLALRGKREQFQAIIFEGAACFPHLNGNEPIAVSTDASGPKFEV